MVNIILLIGFVFWFFSFFIEIMFKFLIMNLIWLFIYFFWFYVGIILYWMNFVSFV